MGSRIRDNVRHFFECFCEVVPPSLEKGAWIIQQFPEKYKDESVLKSVPHFAYPYDIENNVIQHYSFVLTNLESKWTFGFCRHDPNSQTAIIVLSYLPWHQAFYKFLDTIAVLMHSRRAEDLGEFLTAVFNAKISDPGRAFTVPFNKGESIFAVDVPKPFQLPSIPENRNLTEYYNAVDTHNMMVIFASMLFERRIIIKSSKLKRLSACVQSANDVIYPMIWQHIFIPVLPMTLIDYLLAPMPFLIGVPEEVMKKVNLTEIGDVVILDADTNTIDTPFDDLNSIPQEVTSSLKKQLKNKSALLGDAVPRAFLRALVQLIGGYRDALRFQAGQNVTFDEEKFIETRPMALKPFLRQMFQLQIFQQFIDERLSMLNNGYGFSDEFEVETFKYSEKSSSKIRQQYKDWASSMKKEGTAFFKSVKDKANPAVKSAVKTVKDGGKGMKSAYKGLRSKLKENHNPQQYKNGLDSPNDKPKSAPSSPVGIRRTIVDIGIGSSGSYSRKENFPSPFEKNYSPLSSNSQATSPEEYNGRSESTSPHLIIPRMDLMNEMQDMLHLHLETPPIDRSLKPVRSLENIKTSLSTDRWLYSPEKRGALLLPPPSQETQNLLQSPDDLFSSPPLPNRAPNTDLFGTTPFVVAGGHSDNGDPLFYVANRNCVDIVKLCPPVACSPRRKVNQEQDLIRLDSTSDLDDFDPLKSKNGPSNFNTNHVVPLCISNPLYNYENYQLKPNTNNNIPMSRENLKKEQDLLQEYGINFNSFNKESNNKFEGFPSSSKVNSQSNWTTFE